MLVRPGRVGAVGSTVRSFRGPLAVGSLDHRYFTVGTGPQTFSVASGFSGAGITYSVTSLPAAAVAAINPSTGQMTVQTGAAVSGEVVVRATNSAGYAEQTFPLFVTAAASYTVLARAGDGTVAVESLAPVAALTLTRQTDGTVLVQEAN